ncbi:MAG: UDP-3-O-acyl-N-acetylglucosamine deacetylase [bacterium JZ-2024 1]
MQKKTIKQKISLEGTGLYFSQKVSVSLHPAEEKTGMVFLTPQGKLELNPKNARVYPTCTSLIEEGKSLYLLEHFLSACWALGVGNLIVEVQGKEMPILDGSSLEWVSLLRQANLIEQNEEWEEFSLTKPITVEHRGSFLAGIPAEEFRIGYFYLHPEVGEFWVEFSGGEKEYEEEIAPARTFTTESELSALQQAGWVLNPPPECGILFRQKIPHIPLRFPDEPARHKILDALGDFYLFPKRIKCLVLAFQSGHALNHQWINSLFSATL